MRWALVAISMIAVSSNAVALDLHATRVAQATRAPTLCAPVKFNIYFEHDRARLSEPAERMLDLVADHIRGCAVGTLSVDTVAADPNDGANVASARAAVLRDAFRARGVKPLTFVTSEIGSRNDPASMTPPHVFVVIDAAQPSTKNGAGVV